MVELTRVWFGEGVPVQQVSVETQRRKYKYTTVFCHGEKKKKKKPNRCEHTMSLHIISRSLQLWRACLSCENTPHDTNNQQYRSVFAACALWFNWNFKNQPTNLPTRQVWLQGAFLMIVDVNVVSPSSLFFLKQLLQCSRMWMQWIYINNTLLLKSCVTKCKNSHRMHDQCFRQPMSMMMKNSEQVGRWPIKMSISLVYLTI